MLFLSPNSLELPHDVNDKVLKLSKVPQVPSIINALITPEILEYMLTYRFTYLLVVLRTDLFLQHNNLVLSFFFPRYRNKKFSFTLLSIALHCTYFLKAKYKNSEKVSGKVLNANLHKN